jgi:multiple sugar transport system permease protein
MTATATLPAVASRNRFFDALAPGGRRALFVLGIIAVCLLFAFPVLWLVLTSLRPGYAVY